MKQFYRFKEQHPDCVLMFRMGDFYELFDEDAVKVAKAIGLTLTERTAGVPMAGMPHHQLEVYLRRLIDQGFRVAVCDQIQDPKEAKGIVARAVTRVVTPGTLVDDALLADDSANKLAAAYFTGGDQPRIGLAIAELSTGAFIVLNAPETSLVDELARQGVNELLYPQLADGADPPQIRRALDALKIAGTPRPAWQFRQSEAVEALSRQYGVTTLAGFGMTEDEPAAAAAGALVRYLQETQTASNDELEATGNGKIRLATLDHLAAPRHDDPTGLCMVDAVSLRALEVEQTIRSGSQEGSLLGLFLGRAGACKTPMGKRLMREWLCRPLSQLKPINTRQQCVKSLVEEQVLADELAAAIDGVQDVARIGARLALGRATPRDLVALGKSLERVAQIASTIEGSAAFAGHLTQLASVRDRLEPVAAKILKQCIETPPAHMRDGGLIRDGLDAELDEARSLQKDAGTWLAEYQQNLIAEHDLPNLKVGYNRVFGYYIELPAAQAQRAPDTFTRKQTLKNAERYITPQLKEFEDKVTTAESRAVEREKLLFDKLCTAAAKTIDAISLFGQTVAQLDVLGGFADKARRRGWIKPELTESAELNIVQGRHPVLDESLGDNFVPNDLDLGVADESGQQPNLALITGPNMAGKSTFIRQVALITLLAHVGSYVPAESATIGITDRIFTRVGADDALHAGQSTFMVEMTETANILNNATARSLIILDEIGRGTSTLDGLSLAWAIAEYLGGRVGGRHEGEEERKLGEGPRTLFATHYHELTQLEELMPGRVKNLHVAVREWGEEIIFIHRIQPGRTDQSYGIHVAKLAGVPRHVTQRASVVLDSLAVHHGPGSSPDIKPAPARAPEEPAQLSLFKEFLPHPAVNALKEIKLEGLTPLEAFDRLRQLLDMAEQDQ